MKAIICILLLGIFTKGFGAVTQCSDSSMLNDETYIDDIPFNTYEIFTCTICEKVSKMKVDDEPTVKYIFFNTSEIAAKILGMRPQAATSSPGEKYPEKE